VLGPVRRARSSRPPTRVTQPLHRRRRDAGASAQRSGLREPPTPASPSCGISTRSTSLQIGALFAGISRSGTTIVGGLWRGLDHEDAARFGFLLATPVILAAGVLKLPSLAGSAGAHIHGQVVVGVIVAGVAAYFSTRFLMRWFQTRTLTPFAIYCLVFGAASFVRFS